VLTSLIFVALAVAWAVYLVPKALQATDEASVSHSVERFSSALRVLSRREEAETEAASVAERPERRRPSATQIRARREAARRAAQRRRRVLGTILVLNIAVAATAGFGVIAWAWQAAPATLLVAWLVACRLMVRSEQAAKADVWTPTRVRMPRRPAESPVTASPADLDVPADTVVERNEQGFDEVAPEADTTTIAAITEPLWDPVPVTLPTYVSKPAATRRTVRTIDLSAPGVTTSGRTEEDSAIAREADEAERAAKLAAIARKIRRSS
jgi:hypothetical protein